MGLDYTLAIVAGRVVKDVELRTIASGNAVASFTVVSNKRWKDKNGDKKESAVFAEVKAWGKTAEFVSKYFQKGSLILVEGELTQETWEKDGQKRSKIVIEAKNIKFAGDGTVDGGQDAAPASAPAARTGRATAPAPAADDDDSIPF